MDIKTSTELVARQKLSYYEQWLYDEPMFISKMTFNRMVELQKIMSKLIFCFSSNYKNYSHLMPLSEKVIQILDIWDKRPYQIGTYRTDFVLSRQKELKLIEITCRFALNGVFLPSIMSAAADNRHKSRYAHIKTKNVYNRIYNHLDKYINGHNSICILIGGDQRNESKLYKSIFENIGWEIFFIPYTDIDVNKNILERSLVISELSLEELESLDLDIIRLLSELNFLNDLRTVFLVHDKRFFAVIGDRTLQDEALTLQEKNIFQEHYIPTYNFNENNAIWEEAKKAKNNWVIKHRSLGKSQKIYAGHLMSNDEWLEIFNSIEIYDMVLQEWIPQDTISGTIGDQTFKDYLTGTLLFFDDGFYGFGDFRTSSYPIANKVDHRKICSLILSDDSKDMSQFQLYI